MLENELFALLERTADAAFVLSETGEIRYWNKAAERLFGYAADEVRLKGCHTRFFRVSVSWAHAFAAKELRDGMPARKRSLIYFEQISEVGCGWDE